MSQHYEKLKELLKELFQLDQPDLDFGFYRIMHAKSGEITQFLDNELLPQVKQALSVFEANDKADIQKKLEDLLKTLKDAGVEPDQSEKYKTLRKKLTEEGVDINQLEADIYDSLYGFFRRYYSEGDFISKRVYKEGVYAVPYEGEEVKLYWANDDQYYIKTSEYLRDYTFRLNSQDEGNPGRVHFRLRDAVEGAHNNVKEVEGKNRVFILSNDHPVIEDNGELMISFEYRPAALTDWPEYERQFRDKPPQQKELIAISEKRILEMKDERLSGWITALSRKHVKADGEEADYCSLTAHLNRYTARNTFDYFIHKNLGKFLKRELDFYIKNEIMHLDDIDHLPVLRADQYLTKIKAMRRIAHKIIDFLAQLEDFQKTLWLKKKFVIETNYCMTLDRVPEAFYAEIAANDAQREEWIRLFAIDEIKGTNGDMFHGEAPGYSAPLTTEFLKANDKLMVDTKFFTEDFKSRLLDGIHNFDEQMDGVLIHSENFQALNLLQARYKEQVKCIYIDPPYNTEQDRQSGKFIYKDSFESSSWLTLMLDRIYLAYWLLRSDATYFLSIDHNEISTIKYLLDTFFIKNNFEGLISWRRRHNQPNDKTKMIGMVAEYILCYAKNSSAFKNAGVGKLDLTGDFSNPDNDPRGDWASKPWKVGSDQSGTIYTITSPTGKLLNEEWMGDENTYQELLKDGRIYFPKNGDGLPRKKYYRSERETEGQSATNWWEHTQFGHNQGANDLMTSIFGIKNIFSNPKPIELMKGILLISNSKNNTILDYFAGSGTTGHAIINLNREDKGKRKYVLIEMADYFDTVLKPRIQKVIYSNTWKDGKPVSRNTGISQCFKYLRLESYEDTLNNLHLHRSKNQQSLFDSQANTHPDFKEQYLIHYMLNTETLGSDSLLNVQAFTNPTSYTLKVKIPGSDETREMPIDLVETFNYLIGLQVRHTSVIHTFDTILERNDENRWSIKTQLQVTTKGKWRFRTVIGYKQDGQKILIIWRNRPGGETPEGLEQDNLILNEWFNNPAFSFKSNDFNCIYVNGTHNLDILKTGNDNWKVKLIEDVFKRLMFGQEEE